MTSPAVPQQEPKTAVEIISAVPEQEESVEPRTAVEIISAVPEQEESEEFIMLSCIPEPEIEFTTVIGKENEKNIKNKRPFRCNNPNMKKSMKSYFERQIIKINLKKELSQQSFKNITVIGDNHSRGLAELMTSSGNGAFIKRIFMPGADPRYIATTPKPPFNHAYVIITGTEDVSAGREVKIFENMEKFIIQCKEFSKVLVSPLFPRHDVASSSPIHETIIRVNNFLSEICCRHDGVEMLDIGDLGRHHFTNYGFYLNAEGKKLLAALILRELLRISSPTGRPSTERLLATQHGVLHRVDHPFV